MTVRNFRYFKNLYLRITKYSTSVSHGDGEVGPFSQIFHFIVLSTFSTVSWFMIMSEVTRTAAVYVFLLLRVRHTHAYVYINVISG